MMSRISFLALGGMTVAALVWGIESSSPPRHEPLVVPALWSEKTEEDLPAVEWSLPLRLDLPSEGLLGEPLGSFEQEVQRAADELGLDSSWLLVFVVKSSEVNCGVEWSGLPDAQKQEMLNLTLLFLLSNFQNLPQGFGSTAWMQDLRASLTTAEKAEMSQNDFRQALDAQIRQLLPHVEKWEEALVDEAFDPLFVALQVGILREGKQADSVQGLQCVTPAPKENLPKRGPVRIAMR